MDVLGHSPLRQTVPADIQDQCHRHTSVQGRDLGRELLQQR